MIRDKIQRKWSNFGNVNIPLVLLAMLRGRIEAILIKGSDHCEFTIFHFFIKVDFFDTSTVILMILKMALQFNWLDPITWVRIMHFYPSQSNSLKRVADSDEH